MSRCCMILATCLVAVLAATTDRSAAAGDRKDQLDLPHYSVGDQLTWRSDGTEWTETVTAVDGDLVTWKFSNGDVVKSSANFVLPAAEGSGAGSYEVAEADGGIFPLKSGNWVNLRIRDSGDDAPRTRFCRVGDWSQREVAAGRFEVVEVSCQEANRTKVWYYAPAIGTYIEYINTHRYEGTVSQELVAIHRAGE